MEVNLFSCLAWNWSEYLYLKKKSILDNHICPSFMWICLQLLPRGLLIFCLLNEYIHILLFFPFFFSVPVFQIHLFCELHYCDCFQVRSVVLHTLNRARFEVAVNSFLKTGWMIHVAYKIILIPLILLVLSVYHY